MDMFIQSTIREHVQSFGHSWGERGQPKLTRGRAASTHNYAYGGSWFFWFGKWSSQGFWSFFFKKQKLSCKMLKRKTMWTQKVHAEVVNKSISLIRALQEPGDVQPLDIMALNSLASTLTNELCYCRIVTESHFFKDRSQRQTCTDSQCGFCGYVALLQPSSYIFFSYNHVC